MNAPRAGERDLPAPGAPFSSSELHRRRELLEGALSGAGAQHALLYGANRSGGAVPWITGWPVSREAHVLVTPGHPDVLLVNFFNHVPEAARRAACADVRWAGEAPTDTVADVLRERGAPGDTLAVVGALPYTQYAALAAEWRLVDLNRAYTRLRLVKSPEEIEALRAAAALTDLAAGTLVDEPVVGRTEHELVARIEYAYVSRGGAHHIHYLGVTSMDYPQRCVPAQLPSARPVQRGDVITFEISAAVAPEYAGQLLRTLTVGQEPSAAVRRLHDVAELALDAIEQLLRPGTTAADLEAAGDVIEDSGFTIVDDLVHGFGGGYLPPVLGTRGRRLGPTPELVLEEGMTVVVQPNVVARDHTLGVQTGELMLVGREGATRLHTFPRGLRVLDVDR